MHLNVSLCCWQIWHLEAAVARSGLVSESLYCWAHAKPPSIPPWPFCSCGHWAMTRMAREKRLTVPRIYLLDYWTLSWSQLLVSIYMGNKYLHILCIATYFLLRCFSHRFSNHDLSMSMTIQPIHFTAHESMNNRSSGQVLPTVKISLCQQLSELSQKGFVML